MRWFRELVGRDRELDVFAEAIRPELQALRTPLASRELFERIGSDRDAGIRVILPVDHIRRRSMRRYAIAAIVIVAALLALPVYHVERGDAPDTQPAAQFFYLGGIARAQEPRSVPNVPAALPAHPERLHAGMLEYHRVWQDSAGRVTKTVNSALSLVAEGASWRVVSTEREETSSDHAVTAETLVVDRSNLRLLSRDVHVRPYRRWSGINIEQRVSTDSVRGRMTLDDVKGMRPIARRLPPTYAPYLADAFAPLYLASVPLSASWQGRVTILGWAVVPNDVMIPVEMRVTGAEDVTVPAGRFECWKLNLRYAGGALTYWVRKSDGVGVRTMERLQDGGLRTVTLQREVR